MERCTDTPGTPGTLRWTCLGMLLVQHQVTQSGRFECAWVRGWEASGQVGTHCQAQLSARCLHSLRPPPTQPALQGPGHLCLQDQFGSTCERGSVSAWHHSSCTEPASPQQIAVCRNSWAGAIRFSPIRTHFASPGIHQER